MISSLFHWGNQRGILAQGSNHRPRIIKFILWVQEIYANTKLHSNPGSGIINTTSLWSFVFLIKSCQVSLFLVIIRYSSPPLAASKILNNPLQQSTGLPTFRVCNHFIPLIPGARPVAAIRPYRCPSKLITDELKMLPQGLIQSSVSLFSSLFFMVSKKDETYHFCVYFRHWLNALTLKFKFHVPIFY